MKFCFSLTVLLVLFGVSFALKPFQTRMLNRDNPPKSQVVECPREKYDIDEYCEDNFFNPPACQKYCWGKVPRG